MKSSGIRCLVHGTLLASLAAFGGCGGGSTPSPPTAAVAGVTLSAPSLTFTSQSVGTTSAAQPIMVSNSGTAALSISNIVTTANFVETNNCPASLAASANCTVQVSFMPTSVGTLAGSLSITDNAAGSPQSVTLMGTATAAGTAQNCTPAPVGSVVGTVSLVPRGVASSTGTDPDEIGFAFAPCDVPAGTMLAARRSGGGANVRASTIFSNHWPDGSLRWATLRIIDDTPITKTQAYDVYTVSGTQGVSHFDPWAWIANSPNDLTVHLTNCSGSESGPLPDLNFSLKTAIQTTTRREILADTPNEVVVEVWQLAGADQHLRLQTEIHFLLASDGMTPTALVIYPVFTQDWWSTLAPDGTVLLSTPKEERTYDAQVLWGTTVLNTEVGLHHAYHTRWASLDADADGHWINLGSMPKPQEDRVYSIVTLQRMMRAGYLPPLRLAAKYPVPAPLTYTPLGGNGHRTGGLAGTGGYPGRGLLTTFDVQAILDQSQLAWSNARIAAHANLSYNYFYRDPRQVNGDYSAKLIPLLISEGGVPKGHAPYAGLAAPVSATLRSGPGGAWLFQTPNGGTGIAGGQDAAHMVNPAYMSAFLLGRYYMIDAVLSGWDYLHRVYNYNSYGHNKTLLYLQYAAARGFPSEPTTTYSQLIDIEQERGLGWAMMTIGQANAITPDGSVYQTLVADDTSLTNDYLRDSLLYFPPAQLAKGLMLVNNPGPSSLWMDNFIVLGGYFLDRLTQQQGFTGFHNFAVGAARRDIDAWKDAPDQQSTYRDLSVLDDNISVFAPENEFLAAYTNSVASSVISWPASGSLEGVTISNGDPLYMSDYDTSGIKTLSGPGKTTVPAGLVLDTKYYVVNVTPTTFQVATTPGGSPITGIADQALVTFGIMMQDANTHAHVGDDGYMPATDSYTTIASAAFQMAEFNGDPDIDAATLQKVTTYMSTFKWTTINTWDFDSTEPGS
ncbi:MAG: choice-of-anchor D domain-containing protein [Gammaproteobacteria bacterium]